jgi:hypothetical protein
MHWRKRSKKKKVKFLENEAKGCTSETMTSVDKSKIIWCQEEWQVQKTQVHRTAGSNKHDII